MKQAQLSTRIDPRIKKAVAAACRQGGVKVGRFVEDALADRLEEMADSGDIERLRREPTRPFEDVLRDLELADDI